MFQIAKNNGGEHAAEQVAFLWAKSLGGDSAIKLLNRLGLLNECIDHASDSYQVTTILHSIINYSA